MLLLKSFRIPDRLSYHKPYGIIFPMSDIKSKIVEKLKSEELYSSLLPKEFNENTNLIDCGVLDSLGLFEFVIYLENSFGVKIDVIDLQRENFNCVKAISNLVESKMKKS